jgi:hypothetical protein
MQSTGSHSTTHSSLSLFSGLRFQSLGEFCHIFNPQKATNTALSGAQIVFRSFIQPVFARYFSGAGATAANLRSKVDSATSDKTL